MRALLAALLMVAGAQGAAQPRAHDVTLEREAGRTLGGTLLAPAQRAAAPDPVLILPGSGPTDRDGNSPLGIAASTYRRLAEGLAAHGVATLRVDKRGIGASRAALAREDDSTLALAAADARAWAAHLRERTGARCTWLLGHSEGALVALLAADADGICGLILVSALGRPAGEVLREQLRANPANAPILDEALAAIAELEAGRTVDVAGMHPALLALFRPSVQPHMRSLLAVDPAQALRAFGGPVLVVQGTTDLQVGVKDAERLAGARPGVELVLLPGVNHVLKRAPGERAANLATYADPSLPLADGVVEPIAAFVHRHARAALTAPR